jgi:protein-S-isoprenylcysteine O-methyltransferase Ste14
MTTLVLALGWRPTLIGRTLLVAVVVAATGGFLALGALAIDAWGLPALAVQAASWMIWLLWLGAVFPHSRERMRVPLADLPYRRAFLSEILPGIGCSFAQLARPAVEGLSRGRPFADGLTLLAGLPVVLAGATLIVLGASALGVARTLFVHEYVPVGDEPGGIMRSGIYSYIRHPLFVGGIACSVGLALCVGTRQALVLAALNLCSLPAYVIFEDLRCSRVIGPSYLQYRRTVGAVVPRIWRLTRGHAAD